MTRAFRDSAGILSAQGTCRSYLSNSGTRSSESRVKFRGSEFRAWIRFVD